MKLHSLLNEEESANFNLFESIFNIIEKNYTETLNTFYIDIQREPIENIDITTVINFNRELFTSNKAILMAVKDFILNEKEAQNFNEIPIYKT